MCVFSVFLTSLFINYDLVTRPCILRCLYFHVKVIYSPNHSSQIECCHQHGPCIHYTLQYVQNVFITPILGSRLPSVVITPKDRKYPKVQRAALECSVGLRWCSKHLVWSSTRLMPRSTGNLLPLAPMCDLPFMEVRYSNKKCSNSIDSWDVDEHNEQRPSGIVLDTESHWQTQFLAPSPETNN